MCGISRGTTSNTKKPRDTAAMAILAGWRRHVCASDAAITALLAYLHNSRIIHAVLSGPLGLSTHKHEALTSPRIVIST